VSDRAYSPSYSFTIEGQFLEFSGYAADPKRKYLKLQFSEEMVLIKIPKSLRIPLRLMLKPGDRIRVIGVGAIVPKTGELELKANDVVQLSSTSNCQNSEVNPPPAYQGSASTSDFTKLNHPSSPPLKSTAKILICQKSGCLKRGGRAMMQALEAVLRDRHLDQTITIKPTGCQKRCSSAPNMVMMPGHHRCSSTSKEAIAGWLDRSQNMGRLV
jgi:hypothetical protein